MVVKTKSEGDQRKKYLQGKKVRTLNSSIKTICGETSMGEEIEKKLIEIPIIEIPYEMGKSRTEFPLFP